MGCVTSKQDINDLHPNIFKVTNVDDNGQALIPGQLEVTETEMVLYQHGKQVTHWPLAYIRRYGFYTEHFSFESGRRCPTGAGIFSFRCRRAEQLFNLLHQHVATQGNQNEEAINHTNSDFPIPATSSGPAVPARPQHTDTNNTDTQPHRMSITRTQNMGFTRLNSITSNGPLSPPAVTPPLVSSPEPAAEHNNNKRASLPLQHSYSNTILPEPEVATAIPQQYMNIEATPVSPTHSIVSESYAQLNIESNFGSCHAYMNVTPGDVTPAVPVSPIAQKTTESMSVFPAGDTTAPASTFPLIEEKDDEPHHCYMNLETEKIEGLKSLLLTTEATSSVPHNSVGKTRKVNYITLDLDQAKDLHCSNSTVTPDSPKEPNGENYTVIDFNKTVALSHSVNPSQELDSEGSRKTRHNSTISDLGPIAVRQSSSISD